MSICMSMYLSLSLSNYLTSYLPTYLPLSQSLSLSLSLYIYISCLHRRQDTRQDPAQPSHAAPRPGTPTREPMWIPERPRDIDTVFVARLRQEKCQEQNADLFSTYVDLTKAFDTGSHEGLWRIMSKYGCPRKFIAMVKQFHDGMQARAQDSDETYEPFFCHKRCEARMRPGTVTVQCNVLRHANGCL